MRIINLQKLELVTLTLDQIKPYAQNPREHPQSQIDLLKAGISRFGFNSPILVSREMELIAGHGRLTAARQLGLESVPAIILPHLSEAEQRAYRIADNAIALKGKWSMDLLSQEVSFLVDSGFEFGAEEFGFETGEFDFVMEGPAKSKRGGGEAEVIAEVTRCAPPVSRIGDIWSCAGHRIICGDARFAEVYAALLGEERADAIFSDMPYNVPVKGHISGLGKIEHREFPMASGEMNLAAYKAFMRLVFEHQADFSKPGALNYQFIDWRSVAEMITVGREVYDAFLNLCVWVKPSGSMGSLYRSRHELVGVFRVKGAKHNNFVNLGKDGRNRTNVWEYASPTGFGVERKNLVLHPTCKNQDMIADAIMDCTKRKAIVLDAFLGSGTLILAAHKVGRFGRGIELDPYYVDLAVTRIAELSGEVAVNAEGRTFDEVRTARAGGEG